MLELLLLSMLAMLAIFVLAFLLALAWAGVVTAANAISPWRHRRQVWR